VTPALRPGPVHIKKEWGFRHNPFPSNAIARLGGEDNRENGLLFRPEVQAGAVDEVRDKFILGAAYSGLKFGYLWSLGSGARGGDARGYGKSSLLQYTVERINEDWGSQFLLDAGLDEDDVAETPLCAVLASFDMATVRSLHAVFFEATSFACRFKVANNPTLARRLYLKLCKKLDTDEPSELREAILDIYDAIVGRTLGPPEDDFVRLLCGGNERGIREHISGVGPAKRARATAANYFATLLLFAKAAGIRHVFLGCDQLEDFAATTTAKQKRAQETERFRDYVLELQPMADMLTVVVTLHPRAATVIGTEWRLADLPSFNHADPQNERHVVVLQEITRVDKAEALLAPYLRDARKDGSTDERDDLYPFTEDAVSTILQRSDGKARDILRRAHALIEKGAEQNWDIIDADRASEVLDAIASHLVDDDEVFVAPSPESVW
jgi:hypothetical protein